MLIPTPEAPSGLHLAQQTSPPPPANQPAMQTATMLISHVVTLVQPEHAPAAVITMCDWQHAVRQEGLKPKPRRYLCCVTLSLHFAQQTGLAAHTYIVLYSDA